MNNTINGITISSTVQDQETAVLIRQTREIMEQIIEKHWGLPPPKDLFVYTMTEKWFKDIFSAAPPIWRFLLAITSPFWYIRIHRMWPFIGGWQQQFGRRRVVGVKPPHLLKTSNRSIGEQIYNPETDYVKKFQLLLCHELMHAFTAHLRLPVWLNEGLAMLAVDQYSGKPTIKIETLNALRKSSNRSGTTSYRGMDLSNPDIAVYIYARGYWITRYLETTNPGVLKKLLEKRHTHKNLHEQIAKALQLSQQEFWKQIDGLIVRRFASEGN